MNNDEYHPRNTFKRIGSTGLVIFERDGTLLRQNYPLRDFMLGDISNEFVQMLRQLRLIDVRFGFISDARGMDAGSHGSSEFAALTGQLDKLLRIRGAMPDFWIAWSISQEGSVAAAQAREEQRRADGWIAGKILQAVRWYGVDRREVIFVNSTVAGLLAANEADISTIQYSGLPTDRTIPPSIKMEAEYLSPPETMDTHWLLVEIKQIMGLSTRQSA